MKSAAARRREVGLRTPRRSPPGSGSGSRSALDSLAAAALESLISLRRPWPKPATDLLAARPRAPPASGWIDEGTAALDLQCLVLARALQPRWARAWWPGGQADGLGAGGPPCGGPLLSPPLRWWPGGQAGGPLLPCGAASLRPVRPASSLLERQA